MKLPLFYVFGGVNGRFGHLPHGSLGVRAGREQSSHLLGVNIICFYVMVSVYMTPGQFYCQMSLF